MLVSMTSFKITKEKKNKLNMKWDSPETLSFAFILGITNAAPYFGTNQNLSQGPLWPRLCPSAFLCLNSTLSLLPPTLTQTLTRGKDCFVPIHKPWSVFQSKCLQPALWSSSLPSEPYHSGSSKGHSWRRKYRIDNPQTLHSKRRTRRELVLLNHVKIIASLWPPMLKQWINSSIQP